MPDQKPKLTSAAAGDGQSKDAKIKVLFLCMGNICRSPTAEGVFRQVVMEAGLEHRFVIDSAGTHAYHVGEAPDPRSVEAALQVGVDLRHLRARQLKPADFQHFDYILAMDKENLRIANELMNKADKEKTETNISKIAYLALFLSFAPKTTLTQVPDPYYGENDGFLQVIDLVRKASHDFLTHLRTKGVLD